jgi:hypothetical protein
MQVNANRDAPKRNAHCTKAGPGRRHNKAPAPRADKAEALRFVPGAKMARLAQAKTLTVAR